jgi:hypothetical protein
METPAGGGFPCGSGGSKLVVCDYRSGTKTDGLYIYSRRSTVLFLFEPFLFGEVDAELPRSKVISIQIPHGGRRRRNIYIVNPSHTQKPTWILAKRKPLGPIRIMIKYQSADSLVMRFKDTPETDDGSNLLEHLDEGLLRLVKWDVSDYTHLGIGDVEGMY